MSSVKVHPAIFSRRLREATAASSHLFAPQAPGSLSVSGHFHFYGKGGETVLCKPTHTPPRISPAKPLAPKIGHRNYILSEHRRR